MSLLFSARRRKRPRSTSSARSVLRARSWQNDIAAMTVDVGVLLYGVEED
jgi:hypothetical protein